ncbi:hypothetical protein [Acinetobacter boissieri]|uniref:Uncharacterized protein n=1 Tax=Acinetobacter boissieri TaxID=1219383 RepID=A0A1G6GSI2_9GAMM|nr:hypothetical protein [Acinetobacter boissieri]SDB84938.1 hypothetical protein SAMN05421733_102140 [Acinetobacter boissieri]
MKMMPEQMTTITEQQTPTKLKIDAGAICFFLLGIFIAAFALHHIFIV